jgi:hypothetical protein
VRCASLKKRRSGMGNTHSFITLLSAVVHSVLGPLLILYYGVLQCSSTTKKLINTFFVVGSCLSCAAWSRGKSTTKRNCSSVAFVHRLERCILVGSYGITVLCYIEIFAQDFTVIRTQESTGLTTANNNPTPCSNSNRQTKQFVWKRS